jgi:hypothetical protein
VARVTRGAVVRPAATSVSACLGRHAGFAEVAAAIATEASSAWQGDWTAGDAGQANQHGGQFADPLWTWRS